MDNVFSIDTLRQRQAGQQNERLFTEGTAPTTKAFSFDVLTAAVSLLERAGLVYTTEEDGREVVRMSVHVEGVPPDEVADRLFVSLMDVARSLVREEAEGGKKTGLRGPAEAHPWRTVDVNGTFRIPPADGRMTFASLKAKCSNKGRKLGRVFKCHEYPDGTFEVWRQS